MVSYGCFILLCHFCFLPQWPLSGICFDISPPQALGAPSLHPKVPGCFAFLDVAYQEGHSFVGDFLVKG